MRLIAEKGRRWVGKLDFLGRGFPTRDSSRSFSILGFSNLAPFQMEVELRILETLASRVFFFAGFPKGDEGKANPALLIDENHF